MVTKDRFTQLSDLTYQLLARRDTPQGQWDSMCKSLSLAAIFGTNVTGGIISDQSKLSNDMSDCCNRTGTQLNLHPSIADFIITLYESNTLGGLVKTTQSLYEPGHIFGIVPVDPDAITITEEIDLSPHLSQRNQSGDRALQNYPPLLVVDTAPRLPNQDTFSLFQREALIRLAEESAQTVTSKLGTIPLVFTFTQQLRE